MSDTEALEQLISEKRNIEWKVGISPSQALAINAETELAFLLARLEKAEKRVEELTAAEARRQEKWVDPKIDDL